MDAFRGFALASFAVLGAGATFRWWSLQQEKAALLSKASSPPSVDVATLTAILKELHEPAQTVVSGLIAHAQQSTSPTERKELMEDSSKFVSSGLEKEEQVVCKRHGVTVQAVEEAYRYYSGRADADPETAAAVEAAASPIKKTAGQFLLNKDTTLKMVQCENMSKVMKAVANHMAPTPQNIQMFIQAVKLKLESDASKVTEREFGVSAEQIVMRGQGYAQSDLKFRRALTAIMSHLDTVSQQVLSTIATP